MSQVHRPAMARGAVLKKALVLMCSAALGLAVIAVSCMKGGADDEAAPMGSTKRGQLDLVPQGAAEPEPALKPTDRSLPGTKSALIIDRGGVRDALAGEKPAHVLPGFPTTSPTNWPAQNPFDPPDEQR